MKFCFVIAAISSMTMVGGATASCSLDNEIGDSSGLDVSSPSELNTAEIQENIPDIPPLYSPLDDAVCFNEEYVPPKLSIESMVKLYKDFEKIFEWGFRNQMGSPLQGVSEENNFVTNNRFPGMYLRMCFHDNTVDPNLPDFQDYIGQNFDQHGSWHGFSKYLETSGADASLLVCEKERLHPNNDYDKTASRVLYSMQVGGVIDGGKSLKEKWGLSYADMLHNGCLAAATYLTRQAPSAIFDLNPMQFGRNDACFVKSGCETKFELCGPSNILPGLALSASQVNNWFTSRGMSECLWMSTMWTHSTLDNLASTCPLKLLPCVPGPQETYEFTEKGTDEPYFFPGDRLDYFSFFLQPGSHITSNGFLDDPEDTSCDWKVDDKKKPWPLTAIDCTLGLDNVEKSGETKLKNAILNFHKPAYNAADILMCALNILSGRGDAEGGICDIIGPQECQSTDGHKFGSIFAGSIPTIVNPTNVAKGKTCYQSSHWDPNVKCTRAIDGNTNGNFYTGHSVMHTAHEYSPWLHINLLGKYDISEIIIYDRTDAGAARLDGFYARLHNKDTHTYWYSPKFNGDRKQVFQVPNFSAHELQVFTFDSTTKKYLHIAEVEAYGVKSA